jgi:transcriptional regulator with XRE-family HTH domain
MTEKQKETFARNLRIAAASEGLLQRELAADLGTNQTTISRIYTGERTATFEIVLAAAKRFGTTVEQIINEPFADI